MRKEQLIKSIAREFGCLLTLQLGSKLITVVERNSTEKNSSICHSHDFCDANVFMNAAFNRYKKRDPQADSCNDAFILNEAWNIAKSNQFYIYSKN